MGTLKLPVWPGVIAQFDNNGNADDTDRRGFSRQDVHREVRRDFPGVTAERDNNGNADDADLADCRGFSRRDVHREVRRGFPSVTAERDNNGTAEGNHIGQSHQG